VTYLHNRDFGLEVAKGNVSGHLVVNKFGRNAEVDTATDPADVWDGGMATGGDSSVWVAPTQARGHTIASSSTADDFSASGTGARTLRLWGLTDWDTAEVNEDIELDGAGTNAVATVNNYVIIHRMRVLTAGSGNTNAGEIRATATTDGTVTARISAGKGQTLMAIYGVPSIQSFYVVQWYIDVNKSGAAGTAAVELVVAPDADTDVDLFVVKHHLGLQTTGTSHVAHTFDPPFKIAGPAIIKASVFEVSANNTDVSAGFDGYLVTS